jgi:hypothetical protein
MDRVTTPATAQTACTAERAAPLLTTEAKPSTVSTIF